MSTRLLVYLIGQPGSGKTTLLRAVTADHARTEMVGAACAHMLLAATQEGAWAAGLGVPVLELGRDRDGGFSGTDALAMNVQPKAVEFLAALPEAVVLAEGDRLANAKFLNAAAAAGWMVRVVWLDTPDAVAAGRRARRGSTQNEAWLRGRVTKVRRLAASVPVTRMDGTRPVSALAGELRGLISSWARPAT